MIRLRGQQTGEDFFVGYAKRFHLHSSAGGGIFQCQAPIGPFRQAERYFPVGVLAQALTRQAPHGGAQKSVCCRRDDVDWG